MFLVELRKSLTGGGWLWQQHEQHLACLPDGPAAATRAVEALVSSCCSVRMAWTVPFQRRSNNARSSLLQQLLARPLLLRRFLLRPTGGRGSIIYGGRQRIKKYRLTVEDVVISHYIYIFGLEDLDLCAWGPLAHILGDHRWSWPPLQSHHLAPESESIVWMEQTERVSLSLSLVCTGVCALSVKNGGGGGRAINE